MTGPAVVPTHVTGPVTVATPVTGPATVAVQAVPVTKAKQWMRKSGRLGRRGTPTQMGEEDDDKIATPQWLGHHTNRKMKRKIS